MAIDRFTGKPVDHVGSKSHKPNGQFCDDCGTELIDRCMVCGAPVCCPKCCEEAMQEHEQYMKEREVTSGGAVRGDVV